MALFRRQPRAAFNTGTQPPAGPPFPGSNPGTPPAGGDLRQMLMGAPVDRVRQDLRLMVTRPGPHLGEYPLMWPLGGDLAAVACLKWPEAAVTVETMVAAAWGMVPEDVWLQAATNLRGEAFGVQHYDTSAGVPLTVVLGQGWPGSAQVFRLGETLGDELRGGALVTMPTDNCLLALPMRNPQVLNTAGYLMNVATELTRDQQALDTGLYWWSEGVLERLDVHHVGSQDLRVSGSARFGQAMLRL